MTLTSVFARFLPRAARPALGLRALDALARQRHDLGQLPPERLEDLGLTRAEAQAEAARPVWDVPTHWR